MPDLQYYYLELVLRVLISMVLHLLMIDHSHFRVRRAREGCSFTESRYDYRVQWMYTRLLIHMISLLANLISLEFLYSAILLRQ
jgi:hypothetical protein